MDALDAVKASAQLNVVLAYLGFQRRHDCVEPAFQIAIGDVVDVLDADRDRLVEAFHQRELGLAHHVPQGVEVHVVRALETFDLFLVLEHRK